MRLMEQLEFYGNPDSVCVYFYSSGANQNYFLDSGCVVYALHRLEIIIRKKPKKSLESPTTCFS